MRKAAFIVLLALLTFGLASIAQTDLSDEELLTTLDDARFPDGDSTVMTMEIVADRPDKTEQATVKVFTKKIDGEYYNRVEMLAPEDMAGQVYLVTPEATFFWKPDLFGGPIKIDNQIDVFGDASVAETVGVGYANDYRLVERREITLDSGSSGLELGLEATSDDVAFQSARVTVDAEAMRPLTMRLFAASDDPINDVTFEEYAEVDGDSYVRKELIESQVIPQNKTLVTITDVLATELSDALFDPGQLGADE